ncbi:MAG: hypothetical protein HFH34_09310 [Eubacterium sp.]|nr:hypothetical protein [Eubacterium sp.]
MKLIHAVWEQRNLGVDCWEVIIEKGDSPDEFCKKAMEFETEYTVVKVPETMPEFGFFLQRRGYVFMETMISFRRNTELPVLSKFQQNMLEQVSYTRMDYTDMQCLFAEIRKGMFHTDRVSLDPYFAEGKASERYIGWILDEMARESELFKITYKGKDAGFFGLKQMREGVYFPYLNGIYPGKACGIGFALVYMELLEVSGRNGRTMLGSVSTNNVSSLAVLTSLGFIAYCAEHVYILHKERIL